MKMTTRPGWLFLLLALLAGLTLAFGAACGGGDDDDDDDGGSATATEEADGEETPDEGDGEETDEPTDEPTDEGADAFQDLLNLGEGIDAVTGQITYEFSTTSAGTTTTSTMTYYMAPPNSRVDFETGGAVIIAITKPDISYSCTESGGQGLCFEGEGGTGESLLPIVEQWTDAEQLGAYLDALGDADVDIFDDTIAGQDASCYTVTGNVGGEVTSTFCFSDSGLMLLASNESAGSGYEMRAIEASDDVDDSVFEPPYEILTIPGQ